jgi:hypothetical protein
MYPRESALSGRSSPGGHSSSVLKRPTSPKSGMSDWTKYVETSDQQPATSD